jgi:HTH-type transcriptional regulator/antitoxin HipB
MRTQPVDGTPGNGAQVAVKDISDRKPARRLREGRERLARLLVEERKRRKIRQRKLARRLKQHQSWVSRLESGTRRIDVIEFLDLAEAIGFDPSVALKKIWDAAAYNGGRVLDEALTVVRAAGYRMSKPRTARKRGPMIRSPVFVAAFVDGVVTRMTVFTAIDKLDLERGKKLARYAYEQRTGRAPPMFDKAHFEKDGEVIENYNAITLHNGIAAAAE